LIWVAYDPHKDRYIIYRESLRGNMTTKEHCKQALFDGRNENVIIWTGGAKSETQQRMDWVDAGIPIKEPSIADVESGLDRVIELFKTNRLFIFSDLKGLLDEIGTYSREVDEQGNPTDKIKDKNTFHRLDGLRYVASRLGEKVKIARSYQG